MKRTERLFAIADALRKSGPRGRTTTSLAAEFEVSTRTVKRDMAALYATGIPLTAFDGRGGGYHLLPETSISPVPLTAGEAAAIAIALAAEPQMPFAAEGRTALRKLLGAMTPEQRENAARTAERVWMRRDHDARRPAFAAVIDEAVRSRTVLTIRYQGRDGEATTRAVEPLALARTGGHWYLLAWCRLREDGRWFRLDRITRAWRTPEKPAPRRVSDVFGEPPEDALPASLPDYERARAT